MQHMALMHIGNSAEYPNEDTGRHLSLVSEEPATWDTVRKHAAVLARYRLLSPNLSREEKEGLMLARNKLEDLATVLRALDNLEKLSQLLEADDFSEESEDQ